MIKFIQKLFGGDSNERALKKYSPRVPEINALAAQLQSLSDDDLRAKTAEFKDRIRNAVREIEAEQAELTAQLRGIVAEPSGDGQAAAESLSFQERQQRYQDLEDLDKEWLDTVEAELDALLPEAFAVVKEACRRHVGKTWDAAGQTITWDMVPFDVQLVGGQVLHDGGISEMKTGEGKTLVAVAPVYLNALAGRGVHIVTVNPYLARRDSEWMGPIFQFLGLTVGCIEFHEPHSASRRAAYLADITYGTNNEFGFDYLRDNSFVIDAEQLVQRGHHYAIVDEVDSVLIDEARTPLIISGPVPEGSDDNQYGDLKTHVEKLVYQQQRLAAQLVAEAERLLAERDQALQANDKRKARELEDQAGMALLRAQRGFPKNNKLVKLKQEPGVEQLIQSTLYLYLQDSGRRMPEVDEHLYYSVDEKQHAIEMTDKGRELIAKSAGESIDFFVIPDMGDEVARLEKEYRAAKDALAARLRDDATLSAADREKRLADETGRLSQEMEHKRREVNTLFATRSDRIHAVNQLLRAYTLYAKDDEYIVQDDKILIVDEHTGRVLPGRRYSDGLHQAIEAKENVKVQAATQTYATITLQNYFRLYSKLAGMTGTAETEAEEFGKIYNLNVTAIPTNKPVVRQDLEDLIYKNKRSKYKAVIDKIKSYHEKGQPVLVGTTSVEVSETLSRMLQREKVPHNVLNAKATRAQAESVTVAQAGQRGAVTIATNMAGRGTDIKLGAGVSDLGGLAILGTERHESRRIDLQLRGRAGRQGDPGETQFYISLEDDLMRLFGDRTAQIMDKMGMQEDEVITHRWITKAVERAQRKVEQNNFGIRKRQLEYDDVLNAQRQVIYDRRMHALQGERLHGDLQGMLRDYLTALVKEHYGDGDFEEIRAALLRHLAFDYEIDREQAAKLGDDGLTDALIEAAWKHYEAKRALLARPYYESALQIVKPGPDGQVPPVEKLYVDFTDGRRLFRAMVRVQDVLQTHGQEINDALERTAILAQIDQRWTEHLRDLDEVREGVGLRAYGQKDPLVEYKMEAFRLFKEMLVEINREVLGVIFKAGPLVETQQAPRRAAVAARPHLDARKAQARQQDLDPDYATIGRSTDGPARRDPNSAPAEPAEKARPVVVERRIGRNEMVLVQNPKTGERIQMKYKVAQAKIDQEGWVLLS